MCEELAPQYKYYKYCNDNKHVGGWKSSTRSQIAEKYYKELLTNFIDENRSILPDNLKQEQLSLLLKEANLSFTHLSLLQEEKEIYFEDRVALGVHLALIKKNAESIPGSTVVEPDKRGIRHQPHINEMVYKYLLKKNSVDGKMSLLDLLEMDNSKKDISDLLEEYNRIGKFTEQFKHENSSVRNLIVTTLRDLRASIQQCINIKIDEILSNLENTKLSEMDNGMLTAQLEIILTNTRTVSDVVNSDFYKENESDEKKQKIQILLLGLETEGRKIINALSLLSQVLKAEDAQLEEPVAGAVRPASPKAIPGLTDKELLAEYTSNKNGNTEQKQPPSQ